jgi:hypothetical protein
MEKKDNTGLHVDQKAQGVWERRTGDRRLGQNQLFGSFRVDSGVRVLSGGDPTDDALAAIASILDRPNDKPTTKSVDKSEIKSEVATPEAVAVAPQPPPSAPAEVDHYVKLGPGPLDAIRFKWAARPADNGNYFVEETIGNSSRTMTSGPMSKEEAIRLVDQRESDALRRFDALKSEMTGHGASAANPARNDAGEK